MPHNKSKRLLCVIPHLPHTGIGVQEGIEFLLAASAFIQHIDVLFTGAGVLQLRPSPPTGDNAINQGAYKDTTAMLSALPLYDITHCYADTASLQHYGISPEHSVVPITTLEPKDKQRLLQTHDTIFNL